MRLILSLHPCLMYFHLTDELISGAEPPGNFVVAPCRLQQLLACCYSLKLMAAMDGVGMGFSALHSVAKSKRITNPHIFHDIELTQLDEIMHMNHYHGSELLERKVLPYEGLLQPSSIKIRLRRIINFSTASSSRSLNESDDCFFAS